MRRDDFDILFDFNSTIMSKKKNRKINTTKYNQTFIILK